MDEMVRDNEPEFLSMWRGRGKKEGGGEQIMRSNLKTSHWEREEAI